MISYILSTIGLLLVVAIFLAGCCISCWVYMAGLSAMEMELKGIGVSVIISSVFSALATTAICIGILWIIKEWLPIYGATGIF